jgi:hypothetical protein
VPGDVPASLRHPRAEKQACQEMVVREEIAGRQGGSLGLWGPKPLPDQTVSVIADAALRAVAGDLPAVVNVSDADSAIVAEIGRAIMDIIDVRAELIGLPDAPCYPPEFGATPWSIPRPMVCSAAAVSEATYAQSAEPAVRWLVEEVRSDNWREHLPQLAAYQPVHRSGYCINQQRINIGW